MSFKKPLFKALSLMLVILTVAPIAIYLNEALYISTIRTYPNTWYLTIGSIDEDYPWWGLEVDERGYIYVFGQTGSWKPLGYTSLILLKASKYGENVRSVLVYGNGSFMGRDFKIIGGIFYAVGQLTGYGAGGTDAYLVSFYDNGTVILFNTYGSTALDVFWRLTIGRDKSLYLVGYTMGLGAVRSDGFVVKTDLSGNVKWSLVAGGTQFEYLWDGITWYDETADKEYLYIVGQTNSFAIGGGYDCLIMKVDENGMIMWSLVFGTPALDRLDSVLIGEDGYIYAAGSTYNTPTGNPDVLIAKISQEGELISATSFGGDGSDIVYAAHIDKDFLYVAGATNSFYTGLTANYDSFVALFDKERGEVVSFVNFGGMDSDLAYGVKSDANYVYVSGYTASFTEGARDFFIAKMNKDYLLESSPPLLKWVYGDFPEDVNVARIYLPSITTAVNSSKVFMSINYPLPVVMSYTIMGSLVAPTTHIATATGNPPAEITTTTEVSTTTATATITTTTTRTVVDIITDTLTTTATTTETETTTNTVTETLVETTLIPTTIQTTITETTSLVSTLTETTTETKTQTKEQTIKTTETREVSVPTIDTPSLIATGLVSLLVGLLVGWFVLRKIK